MAKKIKINPNVAPQSFWLKPPSQRWGNAPAAAPPAAAPGAPTPPVRIVVGHARALTPPAPLQPQAPAMPIAVQAAPAQPGRIQRFGNWVTGGITSLTPSAVRRGKASDTAEKFKNKLPEVVMFLFIGVFVLLFLKLVYLGAAIVLYAFYKWFPSEMDVVEEAYEKIAAKKNKLEIEKMYVDITRTIIRAENDLSNMITAPHTPKQGVPFEMVYNIEQNIKVLKDRQRSLKKQCIKLGIPV